MVEGCKYLFSGIHTSLVLQPKRVVNPLFATVRLTLCGSDGPYSDLVGQGSSNPLGSLTPED
jgi:hypothetical protein